MLLGSPTTAGHIWREFAPRGVPAGSVLLFEDAAALALIRRAELERIAIVGIDQVRADSSDRYEPLRARPLSPMERVSSWRQARDFVEAFAGRGLYFEVVLESWWRTWLAQWRSGDAGPVG
jgi:hypothetical protein